MSKIDVTAYHALETLVSLLKIRCRVPFKERSVQEQIETESLAIGAQALVEISGSWHPDDMLVNTQAATMLKEILKKEGL